MNSSTQKAPSRDDMYYTLIKLFFPDLTTVRKEVKDIPMELDFYINTLAKTISDKRGFGIRLAYQFINVIHSEFPAMLFQLLLRVIAERLDQGYPDHIRNSERIFIIDMLDGRIKELDINSIKTFKYFAAFRSREDAGIACRILRDLKKDLFTSKDVRE